MYGDRRLSDLDPELQQFAMDAWGAPQAVGHAHLPDQAPDLQRNLWPAPTCARLPAPVQAEAGSMPTQNGVRLDDRDGGQHRRKQTIEPDEEQPVDYRQLRLRRTAPAQHAQLMPQYDDLGLKRSPGFERRDHDVAQQL